MKISVITEEIFERAVGYSEADSLFACNINLSLRANAPILKIDGDSVACDFIFAILDENSEIKGLIKSVVGGYEVFAREASNELIDALGDFFLFHERKSFFSSREIIEGLRGLVGGEISKSIVMRSFGRGENALRDETSYPKLKCAYELLERAFPSSCKKDQLEEWAYNMRRKLLAGGRAELIFDQEERCCACCFVDGDNEECSLISSVAVSPLKRHMGLGSRVVGNALDCIKRGKTVYAVLQKPELTEFYEKIGFSYFGIKYELKI